MTWLPVAIAALLAAFSIWPYVHRRDQIHRDDPTHPDRRSES